MKCQTDPSAIASMHKSISGRKAEYLLLKSEDSVPIYSIRIHFDGESIERNISFDPIKAMEIYCTVVKNLVTPCTLDDIFEDMALKNS